MKERKGEGRRSFSPPQATKLCVLRHLRASWRNEDLANGIPAPRSVCGWSLSTWAPRGCLQITIAILSKSGPRSGPRNSCAKKWSQPFLTTWGRGGLCGRSESVNLIQKKLEKWGPL